MEQTAYEARQAALIEEINAAFAEVTRQGGVSLSESRVIDNYGSLEARAEARASDTETCWQDVPDEELSGSYECFSFLDEIGFRYYMPAFLVWFIRYVDNDDPNSHHYGSNTFEFLGYALSSRLNDTDALDERRLARFKIFTPQQSKAIAHFLQFADEANEKWELDSDQEDLEEMIEAGASAEEIEAEQLSNEKRRIERSLSISDDKRALQDYWGKFL